MDCTTGYNSVTLEYRDQDETINNGNCCDGGVTNDHVVDQQQMNKATTSCSNTTQEVQQPSPSKMMAVNKGKRTKRQRLHNSDPSSIPSSNYNHQEDDLVDEEQLNVAKCLILLAQGQSRPSSSPPPPSVPDYESGQPRGNKRRRRSYSSSSLSLNLTGVYECKTCNRTFPSFQALGGHRASHKKLNITSANSHLDYSFSHEYNPINSTSPFSLQLGNINYRAPPTPTPTTAAVVVQSSIINNNIKSSNKIHECSICAAEFGSGQALGGHMRRHRGPVIPLATTNANTALSLSTAIIDSTAAAAAGKVDPISNNNTNGFLSPDLNLPASPSPESDTKFSLPPKQQPAAMALFSSPALVDCFY